MSDCRYRLEYDATFDELVHPQIRAALGLKTYRRQRRMIQLGLTGYIVYSIVTTTIPRTATYDFGHNVIQWFFAIVFLAITLFAIGPFYDWVSRRAMRKQLQEVYGTEKAFPTELELRGDAFWTKNRRAEVALPWSQCTGVSDAADGIELRFGLPLVFLYNRYFPTTAERTRFLETARVLAGV